MKIKLRNIIIMVLLAVLLLSPLCTMEANAVNGSTAGAWGIDVSKYQGNVDWAAVKNSGVSFAFIKAYSSYSGEDPYFARNINGANAVGIRTGVYVYSYATTVEAAVAEANAVLAIIQKYSITYPVAIDIEDSSQRNLSPEMLAAIANAFCATIENAGYYPMVYSSKSWFTRRIGPVAYDKWVAQYASECEYPGALSFWQYSCEGTVPGIAGQVDLNYQYRDYSFIIPEGFSVRNGVVCFYRNYRWQRGWIDYNGARYYCDITGARRTGWLDFGTEVYYMDENGAMQTGFQMIDGKTYYFGDDGIRRIGLQKIGEEFYLFDAQGVMYRGWYRPEDGTGMTYYFAEDGHMMHGWYMENNQLYFFDENGCMVIGFRDIDGKRYYFSIEGKLQFGWLNLNEGRFYMGVDGTMQYGWLGLADGIYYLNPDTGMMQIGWVNYAGNTYWMDPETGRMTLGACTIGTERYFFDPATGNLYKGLLNDGKGIQYYNETDGHMMTGVVTINNMPFYFDPVTGYMLVNTVVEQDGITLIIDVNGLVIPVQ